MVITDAFWEKRNMGVETAEIKIEMGDSVSECRQNLATVNASYQVVKLPSGMIEMQRMLQDEGFYYMETLVKLKHDLKECPLNSVQKRLIQDASYKEMDDADLEYMFQKIDEGLFTTDRIILDPYFTEKQAHDRYKGWLRDELSRTGKAYKLIYKEDVVGFCVHRVEDKASYGILGGMYPEYLQAGLGFLSLYGSIMIERDRKARCLIADVSTNNMASLRNEVAIGFRVMDVANVFVKHV